MDNKNLKIEGLVDVIDGLVDVANWINNLICSGAMLSLIAIVCCLIGRKEFKVIGIDLNLKYYPCVLLGMTIGHAYLTALFVRKASEIFNLGVDASYQAWIKLTNKGGLIFLGMEPRLLEHNIGLFKLSAYTISEIDLAAWLLHSFVVAALIAVPMTILPATWGRLTKLQTTFVVVFLGSMICLTNWIIGSQWAISASSLCASACVQR